MLIGEKGNQSLPAPIGNRKVQALLVWQDNREGDEDIYNGPVILVSELQTTVIAHDYDPLYRLTGAVYSGDLTASYNYQYDAVGNMIAYTETVGVEITVVNRAFDPANRLQTSDDGSGEVSYTYDYNGNLVGVGGMGGGLYQYDQRNLLIKVFDSPLENKVADYVYDGAGNRVQQILYLDNEPVAVITYTNDNSGLSQVLVSDDGTTQTANLFGLSLIHQDDGATVRTLLADGLGSIRLELVGGAVDSAATYEPYGTLLTRAGPSGTVYGFTGEQHDAATNLLYLRARYYNPSLKVFMSVDPFPGWQTLPASQHPYSYVHNNPVNLTDATGLYAFHSMGAILAHSYGTATLVTPSAIHHRIQSIYGVVFSPSRHAEYSIPGTSGQRIDLLNSDMGWIWEIKPRDDAVAGAIQVRQYVIAMNSTRGRGLLTGPAPFGGGIYDWNFHPLRWMEAPPGHDIPARQFLGTDPAGYVNFYAGQFQPGVIVWWKEARSRRAVIYPIPVPENVTHNQRNWYPTRPQQQLAYAAGGAGLAYALSQMCADLFARNPGAVSATQSVLLFGRGGAGEFNPLLQ